METSSFSDVDRVTRFTLVKELKDGTLEVHDCDSSCHPLLLFPMFFLFRYRTDVVLDWQFDDHQPRADAAGAYARGSANAKAALHTG